jgi:hypothetical protein
VLQRPNNGLISGKQFVVIDLLAALGGLQLTIQPFKLMHHIHEHIEGEGNQKYKNLLSRRAKNSSVLCGPVDNCKHSFY